MGDYYVNQVLVKFTTLSPIKTVDREISSPAVSFDFEGLI